MDARLVARFTSLWTQTQSSVLAFVNSTVTNFADAEDLLQKVAGVAVSKFESFDQQGDAKAFTNWAIQIARYEVLSFLRSRSTDRHSFIAETVDSIADAFAEIADEVDDRRHALAECVKKLEGRSKSVLEKRYGQGLKTGKIAEVVGTTPGNISLILHRTYKKLKECIDARLSLEAG